MNTFLPVNYRFSPNRLSINDILKYSFTHPKNSIPVYLLWMVVLMLFLFLIEISIHISGKKVHFITPKSCSDVLLRVMACAGIILSGAMAVYPSSLIYSSYVSQPFKYADKGNLSVRMLANSSKPIKINDHKPYPYRLYYNDEDGGYLGTMKNGKFTPSADGLAPTFYKYYQYIQQHKLADKFKYDATLKRDGRYQTHNGKAQWVLTNNKDVMLHLADNTKVKQTHVVKD